MTICVSVKTRDGIVLGTDSMTTVMLPSTDDQPIIAKTFSNARKLMQFRNFPVGVFTYGLGNLGPRTVNSHILGFSHTFKQVTGWTVQQIANGLLEYMMREYDEIYEHIEDKQLLGLHVAGYSYDSALPEEWKIEIPHTTEAIPVMSSGVNWEGIILPFGRLYHGYDFRLIQALEKEGVGSDLFYKALKESPLIPHILFDAMPLQDAINYVVYVLRTTIGFTSFEIGPPSCGGQLQVAVISEEGGFQWISRPEFRIPEDTNEWA